MRGEGQGLRQRRRRVWLKYIETLRVCLQLERRDVVASQQLRAALTKAEQSHPGVAFDLVMGIIRKTDLNVDINESILRLQGSISETDCE